MVSNFVSEVQAFVERRRVSIIILFLFTEEGRSVVHCYCRIQRCIGMLCIIHWEKTASIICGSNLQMLTLFHVEYSMTEVEAFLVLIVAYTFQVWKPCLKLCLIKRKVEEMIY